MKKFASTSRVVRIWRILPGNIRGAAWMVLSVLLATVVSAIVKYLGSRLHGLEIAFFRSALGFVFVLPFIIRSRGRVFRTERVGMHVLRSLIGVTGLMCGFYALTRLNLADAAAIGFTKPLFLVILAALMLGETVRMRRWSATAIGFVGVLVMLRPGQGVLEIAALIALIGAMCGAVVSLLIKRMVVSESPITMLAWLGVIGTIYSAVPAFFVWVQPTLAELGLLMLIGIIANTSQLCMLRAFKEGEASALAPFDYVRLPLSAMLGFWLFSEMPDMWSAVGAVIIVASTLYIAQREAQLRKRGERT